MERHGRFIHSSTYWTAEEQKALLQAMATSVPAVEQSIQDEAQKVASIFAKHDTFQVLSALSLRNHLMDPETYVEWAHAGKSVVVEYASLIALKAAYAVGKEGEELYANGQVVGELQDAIEHVVRDSVMLQVARSAAAGLRDGHEGNPSVDDEIQFVTRLNETAVRNPAYQHHHIEVLRGLYRPFQTELQRLAGFTVDDAIAIADSIPKRVSRRFAERAELARTSFQSVEAQVRQMRKGKLGPEVQGSLPADSPEAGRADFFRELASRSKKDVKRYLKYAAVEWEIFCSADICCFSAEELAFELSLSSDVVEAFLKAFSLEFSSVSPDFYEPSPTHVLRERPILHHDGRYLCPAIMLLDWAIQPFFESMLKRSGGSGWERYHKHRHDWVLQTAVQRLQALMPSAKFHENVFYGVADTKSEQAELDALAIFDSLAMFIEVKGGAFTAPARRGAPDRLKRDIKELLGKSHEQALRAKRVLRRGGRLRDGVGNVVQVPADLRRSLLLSVSLAPIGYVTARLHAEAEYFSAGEYSWLLSLYDLMVVTDVLDHPAFFAHYAKRRVETARLGLLVAVDELDIFGYYLLEGLYLDDVAKELRSEGKPVRFNLLSYTDQFDAYYAYTMGVRRKRAPKPGPQLKPVLDDLLMRLEVSGLPGRLDAALAVLDLDSESREQFARGIERARRIAAREARASNIKLSGPTRRRVGTQLLLRYGRVCAPA